LKHKKGIPLKRRGPPQPAETVSQAARDAVRQIDQIHQDNVDAFAKVAEELLAERGSATFLLSAALAAMTGYTARIKCRSLLSSYEGSVSILLESERELESTSKAWYLLRKHVPEEVSQSCKAMQLVKGRHAAIFDCPQEHQEKVLKAETWRGIKFVVATELPDLEAHPSQGGSVHDDAKKQAEFQRRKWEKIKGAKAAEKRDRAQWSNEDARGQKRKFDEAESNWESGGSGRGFGGRGKGKGGGKGKGTGRGFPSQ
jgi:hypothetical protein